jgi:type III pantothenate kinase
MILGFDIGNTSTTAGIFRNDAIVPDYTFRYPTVKNEDPDGLYRQVINGLTSRGAHEDKIIVNGLAFSSVAPEINSSYCRLAKDRYGITAYEINSRSVLNFRIIYDDPRQLGADRIVNAAAAFSEYGGGNIVVDIGTAVTFCVLLEEGIFDGGIIAPGIGTAISALASRASRLPEVKFEKPDRLVARDTVNALKSGFFYGWLSLAEGIIARIEKEYGRAFRVILTGGYAGMVAEHLSHENTVDQLLAMKGIKIVYDLNK